MEADGGEKEVGEEDGEKEQESELEEEGEVESSDEGGGGGGGGAGSQQEPEQAIGEVRKVRSLASSSASEQAGPAVPSSPYDAAFDEPPDAAVDVLLGSVVALAIAPVVVVVEPREDEEMVVAAEVGPVVGLTGSPEGSIVQVARYSKVNEVSSAEACPLDAGLVEITHAVATNRQWVVGTAVLGEVPFAELCETFFKHKVVGGVSLRGDVLTLLMKKRRMTNTCFSFVPNIKMFGMGGKGGSFGKEQKAATIRIMREFLEKGSRVEANYVFERAAVLGKSTMAIDQAIDSMSARIKTMSHDDFEKEVMRARLLEKDERSLEQALLVSSAQNLKQLRKSHEDSLKSYALMKRDSANEKLVKFSEFAALKALKLWGVDFDTWSIFEMSVEAFMRAGLFIKYSLVLLGPPRTAKTPAAESLAALMAKAMQTPDDEDEDELEEKATYYLKVGTVESLKKVEVHLLAGVPLVFDDITPAENRGTRARMTWNELKHLTYITKGSEGSEALDARNDDITLPPDCPRVFTSNALSPSGWMQGLLDVSALSPSGVRAALHNNAANVESAAIYKRCVFAYVADCLIPTEKRKAYESDCIGVAASKIARFM